MFKYFEINGNTTLDEVKKQYKKLAFKFHPDVGGTVEQMQEVNAEYEEALKAVGKNDKKTYKFDLEFVDIIEKLIRLHMVGVEVEVCGWFVYVYGQDEKRENTKIYKDDFNKIGLHWNGEKKSWFYKPSWWKKQGKQVWNMDKIRNVYGSKKVEINTAEKITA